MRILQKLRCYPGKLWSREYLSIIKEDEIDFLALFRVIYRGRWMIVGITFICTVLAIIYALTLTPLFRASVSMYPYSSSTSNMGSMAGLAANLGISLNTGGDNFQIPDIVKSRRVHSALIHNQWETDKYNNPVNLLAYWEIDQSGGFSLNPLSWIKSLFRSGSGSESSRMLAWEENALEILWDRIAVSDDPLGLVRVDVWMEEPQLAAGVANRIYDLVVDYVVKTESKNARMNRQFIEERKGVVKAKLHEAETNLAIFRKHNRDISGSPELMMAQERLMREVQIQTQVYITLQQQYELASIEEAKQTPSIVILDQAEPAAEKDKPRRRKIVVFAFAFGGILGLGLAFLQNFALGVSQKSRT